MASGPFSGTRTNYTHVNDSKGFLLSRNEITKDKYAFNKQAFVTVKLFSKMNEITVAITIETRRDHRQ